MPNGIRLKQEAAPTDPWHQIRQQPPPRKEIKAHAVVPEGEGPPAYQGIHDKERGLSHIREVKQPPQKIMSRKKLRQSGIFLYAEYDVKFMK